MTQTKFSPKVIEAKAQYFVQKAEELTAHEEMGSEGWMQHLNHFNAELDAWDDLVGPGLREGRVLRSQVHDGYAVYIITKINKATVKLVYLPYLDGYRDMAVSARGTAPRYYAEQIVKFHDGFKKLFAERTV